MAAPAPPPAVQAVALSSRVAALARGSFPPGAAEPLGSQDLVPRATAPRTFGGGTTSWDPSGSAAPGRKEPRSRAATGLGSATAWTAGGGAAAAAAINKLHIQLSLAGCTTEAAGCCPTLSQLQ